MVRLVNCAKICGNVGEFHPSKIVAYGNWTFV